MAHGVAVQLLVTASVQPLVTRMYILFTPVIAQLITCPCYLFMPSTQELYIRYVFSDVIYSTTH